MLEKKVYSSEKRSHGEDAIPSAGTGLNEDHQNLKLSSAAMVTDPFPKPSLTSHSQMQNYSVIKLQPLIAAQGKYKRLVVESINSKEKWKQDSDSMRKIAYMHQLFRR